MSIIVDRLTKIYGSQRALDEITFEAPKGMITGFLGPNGAGKSTTMKIATGYLNATSGRVLLDGMEASTSALEIKKITGYLPENNPLYLEMYVKEFLGFVAASYKIKNRRAAVDKMVEVCGLEREKRKKIGALSKGYRQRVGLAQALIHEPDILILDEPTSGLDPNQLVEIRKVIKDASHEKTVLFSTHIMQEVEAICDKVVIINKGKIVADDAVSTLRANTSGIAYIVEFENDIDTTLFAEKNMEVEVVKKGSYKIAAVEDPRKEIMKVVSAHDLPLLNIQKEQESLERIFQELTQA
jgi:ABC-2 type transport system ATP-binding protein